MNELLFFVLGLVIGGLSGITTICMFQINKNNTLTKKQREDEICEQEK